METFNTKIRFESGEGTIRMLILESQIDDPEFWTVRDIAEIGVCDQAHNVLRRHAKQWVGDLPFVDENSKNPKEQIGFSTAFRRAWKHFEESRS